MDYYVWDAMRHTPKPTNNATDLDHVWLQLVDILITLFKHCV